MNLPSLPLPPLPIGAAPIRRLVQDIRPGLRHPAKALTGALTDESDRWFLWTPVCMGVGIIAYFLPPVEPDPLFIAAAASVAVGAAAVGLRRSGLLFLSAMAIAWVAAGFSVGMIRTQMVATTVLEKDMRSVMLEGRVMSVSPNGRGGAQWIMQPDSIGTLPSDKIPGRIRLRSHGIDADLTPGAVVRARGLISPPPGPVEPGAYDIARRMWFQGIGATGVTFGPPVAVANPQAFPLTLGERIGVFRETLRGDIADRIRRVLDGPASAVAVALVTGDRGAIPKQVTENLRRAGLAHVLAISGLHMMLVSGAIFWIVRRVGALSTRIALGRPLHKWAAMAAFSVAAAYLSISGASVATQRAFVMVAVMTLAVMLGRPALTLRNVALAAIAILIVRPESILDAGFQMSFAAVTALVAAYEAGGSYVDRRSGRVETLSLAGKTILKIRNFFSTLTLTNLIAGTATGVLAGIHFNRIAVYGMAGNLLAIPILGLLIMPLLLAGVVLMPLGMEAPILKVVGAGLDVMLNIAATVSAWPGSQRMIPAAPDSALVLFVIGGCWLCLWRGKKRWIGVPLLALVLLLPFGGDRPDIIIEREGKTVGLMADGVRFSARTRRGRYAVSIWRRRDGFDNADQTAVASPWRCDADGCVAVMPDGRVVAFAENHAALAEDCARADIVIAKVPVDSCPSAELAIGWFDLWRNGAHAIRVTPGGLEVSHSAEIRGNRPWAPRRGR